MSNKEQNVQRSVDRLVVFEDKKIRRIFHKGEWYFSVVDIIRVLTESSDPNRYWPELKKKLIGDEGFSQLLDKIEQLKLESNDGKKYLTDTANTETIFRIIQSIPSPRAEPFKRWLAQVGYERIQEIEDPELATKRTRAIYKAKGYSDEWIEKRMRGIAIREELTDEWDKRGIKLQREYAILTAEISKATFGMTPSEYKEHKGLERENLRDHMTDLELIFSMLGEASTKEIAVNRDARGFDENKNAAKIGGKIARNARLELEQESGNPVISQENYLQRIKEQSMENFTKVHKPQMMVIGIACRTSNDLNEGPQDIPQLWQKFYTENIQSKIPNKASDEVVALYCDYEGDYTRPYSCVIGCAVNSLDQIPEGMVGKIVPESTFALYRAVGDFPKSLVDTWGYIWGSELKRTYAGDYEVYGHKFSGTSKEVDVLVAIEQ